MSNNSFVDVLESNIASGLAEELTVELQSFAKKSGWPSNITSKLEVEYDGSTLVISYPDTLQKTVDALEYGAEGRPPRAVFRPFETRMNSRINKASADLVIQMFMEGEL